MAHSAYQPVRRSETSHSKRLSSVRKTTSTIWQSFLQAWRSFLQQAWWPIETLSWALSLLLYVAIAAVIGAYEGRLSPTMKFGITLNTLVSTMSTIATFLLMVTIASALGQIKWIWFMKERLLADFDLLDEASRGPIGSAVTIWKMRGGYLAILGAALTIANLAVSPFTQQLIAYQVSSVASGIAYMPTITVYDSLGTNDTGITQNMWDGMVDPSMARAILSAIYGPKDVPMTVIPSCATGNCTWPLNGGTYQTLALRHDCVDFTYQLNSSDSRFIMPSGFGLEAPSLAGKNESNIPLMNITALRTLHMPNMEDALDLTPDERFFPSTAFWDNDLGGVYVFAIVANVGSPLAAERILRFCINTLNGTEINGHLTETLISQTLVNITWWEDDFPRSGDFGPTHASWLATNDFLIQTLSGWVYGLSDASNNDVSEDQPIPVWWSSSQVNAIYQQLVAGSSDINDFAGVIVRSMSVLMRQQQTDQSFVEGSMTLDQTVIRIEWGWISLPFLVLILTLVLLLLTLLQSRALRLEPWRNSALATIFHGLDSTVLESLGSLGDTTDMMEVAHDLHVRLRPDRGRWKLKA